jgi:rhomboid protease GluP
MAVGFIPKHIEAFQFSELTPEEALALVIKAAEKSGWQINYVSRSGIMAYSNSGVLKWNAEISITLGEGTIEVKSVSAGSEMVDWGKNKKTVQAFIATFQELKTSYSKEELHMEYLLIEDQLPPDAEDELRLPPATKTQQFQSFLGIFKPVKGYVVTPILMDLNILIFILMVISGAGFFSPESADLIIWGANFKPLTLAGEWWRLITCCFVHIGIIHIVFNMYALLYIGVLLEPILGTAKFLVVYLLTGLVASMTSLWWHDLTVSAGASGAIFGMYGLLFALMTGKVIDRQSNKSLFASIGLFIGYNLLFGLSIGADNAAHMGGLVSGFVIGYTLIPGLIKAENKVLNYGSLIAISVAIIGLSIVVFLKIPNNIGTYEKKMEEFSRLEDQALAIYKLPNETPTDSVLSIIQNKGIRNWEENIKILESLQNLDLPTEYQTRIFLLKEYCELRIKNYQFIYKSFVNNTEIYKQKIDSFDAQITAKINEINGKP